MKARTIAHIIAKVIIWLVIIFAGVTILFLISSLFWKVDLHNQPSTKILDRHNILIYEVKQDEERKTNFYSLRDVPDFIQTLILTEEDKRFYLHPGIDISAVVRAGIENIKAGKILQGASTIDQQVIKLSEQAFDRTIGQKIKENLLALNLNIHYSKDEILLYYINNLPFGNGVRGFSAACDYYFDRSCSSLNKGEIIFLFSLAQHGRFGDFSSHAFALSQSQDIKNYTLQDFEKFYTDSRYRSTNNKAPFFVSWFLNTNNSAPLSHVKTNFDYHLYQDIQHRIDTIRPYLNNLEAYDACVIVMNQNQKVISMNLMRSFGDDKFGYVNGCLYPRQVGSAMKPFLYQLAFEKLGYTGNTEINDTPVNYKLKQGGSYAPKNFDLAYHGKVKLSKALGSSLNIPAIKLLEKIGIESYRDFLHTISNEMHTSIGWDEDPNAYGLTLGLGTKEISPYNFTKLWTALLEKQRWGAIREILSENSNRLLSFPVENWLDQPGTFSKSGTSKGFRDGWTCGGFLDRKSHKRRFPDEDIMVCVRVGNYDGSPMRQAGSMTAGVIWSNVIEVLQQ